MIDPFKLAEALRNEKFEGERNRVIQSKSYTMANLNGSDQAVRFPPRRIYGGDIPTSMANITPINDNKY